MTSAEEMIAYDNARTEAKAALDRDRQRWSAEKAISRPCTADAMRWVLEQADNDYAIGEKFLTAWDLSAAHGIKPYWLVSELGWQWRRARRDQEAEETQLRLTAWADRTRALAPFAFDPTYKVLLATSHKPQARNSGGGIWGRFISSPYAVPLRISSLPVRLAMYLALEWVP